ncbi:hypothetical protein Hdeb2414_s0002g00057161 [Helianthus debilis subsp. tardiflorus]
MKNVCFFVLYFILIAKRLTLMLLHLCFRMIRKGLLSSFLGDFLRIGLQGLKRSVWVARLEEVGLGCKA